MNRKRALVILVILISSFVIFRNSYKEPAKQFADKFRSHISAKSIEERLRMLTAKPHRAGSNSNQAVGDLIIRELQNTGLKVNVQEFSALLPEPKESKLRLVSPEIVEFDLHEKRLQADPYSSVANEEIPFFSYSPDADVETEVVYANFGAEEDYAVLKKAGVDVTGKIVLLRAQGICRGMKSVIAERHGAAGMLLYPDLRDQGFRKAAFPEGPHINAWTLQRGTMLRYFSCPGDPNRLSNSQDLIPKIPALPIHQEAAIRILKNIEGVDAPEAWHGWTTDSYRLGSGPARVRMIYRSRSSQPQKLRNIIATVEATTGDEPSIVVGNHYDAWVYGASDACSGTAVILEAVKGLSKIWNQKGKPKRNVVFAFWDGEEYGMLGSTRWVESQDKPKHGIAAYINIDSAVRAREFVGNISPGLKSAMELALEHVKDPATQKPLSEIRGDFQMPGYSTDSTAFSGRLGLPVAELGFGRWYSQYHSIYDDFYWMSKFGDPGFAYSVALTEVLGNFIELMAKSDLIPFRFTEISTQLSSALTQVELPDSAAVRAFRVAFQRYEQAASMFDSKARYVPGVNRILADAMTSFVDTSESNFYRNLLAGPSPVDGCGGELLPALQKAVIAKDSVAIDREAKKLAAAFDRASNLLNHALEKP